MLCALVCVALILSGTLETLLAIDTVVIPSVRNHRATASLP
jgi:hypothetical protein